MFTLWYAILSYKEYRDVIFAPAPPTPAPASDTIPASIKPLTPIAPTAPQTSPPPVPSPTVPAPTVAPSKTPSLPPSKPPPHPMVTSDVLDDITFEDEDLCDVGADEADPIAAESPTKAPLANVSTFLHEEIRSGAAGQKKRDISRAR